MGQVAPTAVEFCFREKLKQKFFWGPIFAWCLLPTPKHVRQEPDAQAKRERHLLYLYGQERCCRLSPDRERW